MQLNNFGIYEPEPEDVDLANFSAMIIPGLRMGRNGTRLGRGAGYYDRVLNSLPRMSAGGPIRVGIVFDDELDDSVPHEAHDSALDVVVTPSSVLWI
jgi:5-formyltetrahydrofolate cyclo-ligase